MTSSQLEGLTVNEENFNSRVELYISREKIWICFQVSPVFLISINNICPYTVSSERSSRSYAADPARQLFEMFTPYTPQAHNSHPKSLNMINATHNNSCNKRNNQTNNAFRFLRKPVNMQSKKLFKSVNSHRLSCSNTAAHTMILMKQLHCNNCTTTIALQKLHCNNSTAII